MSEAKNLIYNLFTEELRKLVGRGRIDRNTALAAVCERIERIVRERECLCCERERRFYRLHVESQFLGNEFNGSFFLLMDQPGK